MNPRYHACVFAIAKASFAALLFAAALAPAPARACTPRANEARVHVSFLPDSDLTSMVKWVKQQTCADYAFDDSLSGRRLAQGVILTVAGRDVSDVFEILLHTMNLSLTGAATKRTIVATGPELPPSKAARDRAKANSERERIFANIEGEISKEDETHYRITRKGLDAALGNLLALSRTLRLVPERKDGKPSGFRMDAIKPGSLLARIGFQNGDLVQALNDNDITTPDKAIEVYARLRTTGQVRVFLLRAAKPMAIDIKIE